MGSLSNMLSQGRGPRPKSNGSHTGPLRKIVSTRYLGAVPYETLECGHEQQAKSDLMGFTNAVRRRCKTCGRAERREKEAK